MKNELVSKFMQEMLNLLQNAKDFASVQIPDYLQQLLRWKLSEAIFYTIIFSIAAIIVYKITKRFYQWIKDDNCGTEPLMMFPIGGLIGCCVGACYNFGAALKIFIAPKVYLIEYFVNILKEKT